MPGNILNTAGGAVAAGALVVLVLLGVAVGSGQLDAVVAGGIVVRSLHVVAAMVWVGLIFFVNVIQFAALDEAVAADKAVVMRTIVPRAARSFRMAANVTVLTGILLLLALGYFTQRPPQTAIWVWLGTAGGLAMLGFVHGKISPALRVVLDPSGADPVRLAAARQTVRTYARINLVLAWPVTLAMIAAAHG